MINPVRAWRNARALKGLRQKYVVFPPPDVANATLISLARGRVLNRVRALEFLNAHMGACIKCYKRDNRSVSVTREKILRDFARRSNPELRAVVRRVAEFMVLSWKESAEAQARSQYKEYLKERGIELDRASFDIAMQKVSKAKDLPPTLVSSVKAFEKAYLQVLAEKNALRGNEPAIVNRIIEEVFPGFNISIDARKRIADYIRNQYVLGRKQLVEQISSQNTSGEVAGVLFKQFYRDLEADVYEKFAPTLVKNKIRDFRGEAPVKLGVRDERMAAYVPPLKDAAVVEEENLLSLVQAADNPMPRTETALVEEMIAGMHPKTGVLLQSLYSSQRLSAEAIRKIYIAGSLAELRFRDAIESGFLEKFNPADIEKLALGISYIGPQVRKVSHAKRILSPQIFDFLVQRKLIDPSHRGGDNVALVRVIK